MTPNRGLWILMLGLAVTINTGCQVNVDNGDDGNTNSVNDNTGDDDNTNGDDDNTNTGDDDDNANSGDDGNTNDNPNDNTDDNGNDNVDDNANDNTGDDNGNDNASDDNGNDNDDDDMTTTSGWTQMEQPCAGTQTNAFWFDDQDNGYIGCGENANGAGLFVTSDGGQTWESETLFTNVRINDIHRGPDDVLYAAGMDAVDGFAAFSIDESGSRRELVGLYTPSNNAFTTIAQGENIAVTADGQLFIDSLTGTQTAWRGAGAAEFTELSSFIDTVLTDENATSEQVSRVVAHNNRFWAVGSVINQPGRVFVPSNEPGATYHMTMLELQAPTRDGEIHDIYVWSDTSALVAGFDQSLDFPLIYSLDGDADDVNNWMQVDLFDSGIVYQGGAWRMDVVGDDVVLVGQTFPNNRGFVVISNDRGLTWTDISPRDDDNGFAASLMTNVWMFEDGTIYAAAEGGELWHYQP